MMVTSRCLAKKSDRNQLRRPERMEAIMERVTLNEDSVLSQYAPYALRMPEEY